MTFQSAASQPMSNTFLPTAILAPLLCHVSKRPFLAPDLMGLHAFQNTPQTLAQSRIAIVTAVSYSVPLSPDCLIPAAICRESECKRLRADHAVLRLHKLGDQLQCPRSVAYAFIGTSQEKAGRVEANVRINREQLQGHFECLTAIGIPAQR